MALVSGVGIEIANEVSGSGIQVAEDAFVSFKQLKMPSFQVQGLKQPNMPFQDEGLGLETEEGEEESLEAESSSLGTQSELNEKKGGNWSTR